MFVGHWGAGCAAKAIVPEVPLIWFLFVSNATDIIIPILLYFKIDNIIIHPFYSNVHHIKLGLPQYAHSISGMIALPLFLSCLTFILFPKCKTIAPLQLFLVTFTTGITHLFFDYPFNAKSLPFFPYGQGGFYGVNLFSSYKRIAQLVELLLILGGAVVLGECLFARIEHRYQVGLRQKICFTLLTVFNIICITAAYDLPPPNSMDEVIYPAAITYLIVLSLSLGIELSAPKKNELNDHAKVKSQ